MLYIAGKVTKEDVLKRVGEERNLVKTLENSREKMLGRVIIEVK